MSLVVTAFPTIVADDGSGDNAWGSPDEAKTDNNVGATSVLDPVNFLGISGVLKFTGFGFSIPAGSTIDGFIVSTKRKSSVSAADRGAADLSIQMVKGGTAGGTDKADATKYTTSYVTDTHGTTTDLWGQSWTAADVNASNFGCTFSAQAIGTNLVIQTVSLDYVSISVYYTPPATTVKRTLLGVGV